MGVKRGCGVHVIKILYVSSKSVVLLEGEKLNAFKLKQGVAQGHSLTPYY